MEARAYELACHDVILCTCSSASAGSLEKLNVKQILIDECAMSTEPETLIPLVSHKHAEKVSPFQRAVLKTPCLSAWLAQLPFFSESL